MKLQRYDSEQIELFIDLDNNGKSYASCRGYSRMSGKHMEEITARISRLEGDRKHLVIIARIPTNGGMQGGRLIDEELIADWIIDDQPFLAKKMLQSGVRNYLHILAGYQVTSSALSSTDSTLQLILAKVTDMDNRLKALEPDAKEHQSMKPAFEIHKKVPDTMKAIAEKIIDGVGNWNILRVLGGDGWQKLGSKRAKTGKDIKAVWIQTTGSNPPRNSRGHLYPESFLPVIQDQIEINS